MPRQYLAIVTVSIVTPEGLHLGSETDTAILDADKFGLPSIQETNDYVREELRSLATAASSNVENCF